MPGVGSCSLDSKRKKVLRGGLTCPWSCRPRVEWRVCELVGSIQHEVFNMTFFLMVHLKLGKYYPRNTQLFGNRNLKYIYFMEIRRALRC